MNTSGTNTKQRPGPAKEPGPPARGGEAFEPKAFQKRLIYCIHELKSPVAAVHQYLQILLKGIAGSMTDQQQALLGKASARTRQVLDMLEDWLTGARAESGMVREQFRPVRLRLLLEEAAKEARKEGEGRGVHIVQPESFPDLILTAHADALYAAVRHVLRNAVRFSPDGGCVQVEVHPEENEVRVCVTDEGPGIREADLPFVFDEFYRSKDPALQDRTGAGLGLWVARNVLQAHNGRIHLSNRAEGGLEATLVLPLSPASS